VVRSALPPDGCGGVSGPVECVSAADIPTRFGAATRTFAWEHASAVTLLHDVHRSFGVVVSSSLREQSLARPDVGSRQVSALVTVTRGILRRTRATQPVSSA